MFDQNLDETFKSKQFDATGGTSGMDAADPLKDFEGIEDNYPNDEDDED
jgi:hypothetical protein